MVYTLRFFSSKNAVCFIILTYLVPVLFTFYIQGVLKLKKYNSVAKRLIQKMSVWWVFRGAKKLCDVRVKVSFVNVGRAFAGNIREVKRRFHRGRQGVSKNLYNPALLLFLEFYYLQMCTVHSVEQKSIGLKFSKSRTGSHVTYSCCHNSSPFTFPIFVHSWRLSVFHSLQSITPRIY